MRRPAIALCLAAVVLGVACSSGGGEGASPTTEAPAEGTSTSELTLELASSTMPSVSIDIPEEPVATAPAMEDAHHLDVFALDREGEDSVLLVMALRNDSDSTATVLSDFEDLEAEADTPHLASGITLFDPANLKRHLVYLDEDGGCLCSRLGTAVDAGESLFVAALFPAPPGDVESMTVQTPVGSVPDVPITDG